MNRFDQGVGLALSGAAVALVTAVEWKLGSASGATYWTAAAFAAAALVVVAARRRSGRPELARLGSIAALLALAASLAVAAARPGGIEAIGVQFALAFGVLGAAPLAATVIAREEPMDRACFGSLSLLVLFFLLMGLFPVSLLFRFGFGVRPAARPFTFWSLLLATGFALFVSAIVTSIWRVRRRHALPTNRPRD